MASNYVLLEKIVVGAAGASSVTFSSIPQTGYTDLVIKASTRDSSSAVFDDIVVSFNGSAASMTRRFLETTNGSTTGSGAQANSDFIYGNAATATANTFGNSEMYISNYTSSNYKSVSVDNSAENNATAAFLSLMAGLWSNTAAITSISLAPLTGTFSQYSSFYLYGVAKFGSNPKIAPFALGGDSIITDGSYWYHVFRSSGTFRPVKALSVDYLVVAGGGGGNSYGAGGGAGGLRSTLTATGGGGTVESKLTVAKDTDYTVTIGAGGSEGTTSSPWTSSNGSNSVFATITSIGGGGVASSVGVTGGSGGGSVFGGAVGSGTTNQGYAGGPSVNAYPYRGGGGGGAGAVSADENGGAGVAISAFASATGTGVSNYYAGGGGGGSWYNNTGGTGGAGGGGRGPSGSVNDAVAGTANTGGGGGGGGSTTGSQSSLRNGAPGGSGIVIVRYAV